MVKPSATRASYESPLNQDRALAETAVQHHLVVTMTETQENRLVEALRAVEQHGDVSPAVVHDPMSMVLRQQAVQGDLMRWDNDRGRYVLTGTGRTRIRARERGTGLGTLLRFPRGTHSSQS